MPDTSPSATLRPSAVTLNQAQMMRRLYGRCHCCFHSCEHSSASCLIRRFTVPHAVLLERFDHRLSLRRDLLSITCLFLLHIQLAMHQPSLSDVRAYQVLHYLFPGLVLFFLCLVGPIPASQIDTRSLAVLLTAAALH